MTYSMKPVYKKLSKIGFSKKQVQSYLPDWWEDSIASTEAGFQQSLWLISNTFHLDFNSLRHSIDDVSITPEYRLPHHLFKHSVNLDRSNLQPAVSIAMLAAKLTLSALDTPLADLSGLTASKIREDILAHGNKWVDFESLVNYCWYLGIPVIFIEEIPSPKMDGLALIKNERPVIILTKKDKYGVLIFHLAHELGHILLNHVEENGMMIDKKISKEGVDDFECQANEFALELLTSRSNTKFFTDKKYSPKGLAKAVLSKATEYNIDPLHIILNYGFSTRNFPLAKKVLAILVNELEIACTDQDLVKRKFTDNVDLDSITDDEVLRRIIGAE